MSPVSALARPNPVALSDSELMSRVAADGAGAFGQLYDRYSDRAFRVARSVCDDDSAAEHAVQEAFVCIFRSRARYRSERGTVTAWILTTVLHRAIDVCSVRTRHAIRRNPLDALPDAEREAITLAYYGELTHIEIAERLGLPCATVKGRIRHGMSRLRLDFDPGG